ncbi:MAG: translation initiation factor IF-2 [Defluviitaleaceae bacterium]|nr:translation initiation factor IF-2 [Defluviitaleaceae bacterium]
MPKTRIYELAKQLDANPKDIMQLLSSYGTEVKSSLSSVDDSQATRIKNDLRPKTKAADAPTGEERPRRPRPEGEERPRRPRPEGEERPRRPRPEGEERPRRPRPEGEERPRRPRPEGEERPRRPRPEGEERPRRPRPEGEERPRRPRPEGEERPRRPRPEGEERPRRPRPEGEERPRRPRPEGEERPRRPRPEGEERPRRPRPEGEERPRRPRPEGEERPPRLQGDRPPRPQGDRPPRPQGDRPPRPQGDRPPRPQGDRPPRPQGDRPPRPQGDRPPRPQGDRPFRPQGDRPPRPQGDRPPFNRDGRPRPQGGPGGPGGRGPSSRPDGRGGPSAGRGGQSTFGKKPETKVSAEPSKSDRKQEWQKRTEASKTKGKKDATRMEGSDFANRRGGGPTRPRGGGRPTGGRGPSQNRNQFKKGPKKIMPETVIPTVTEITVSPNTTVRDIAEKLYKSIADIVKILMKKGIMATANQVVDFETAVYIGEQFNCVVEEYVEVDVFEAAFTETEEDASLKVDRPPVVVVMGHVDHGKTSLLDVIRDTSVTAGEAGGITQHIGAYTVEINGKPITFLDTPGHEAFTAMRLRGAQVTDIAILVVAANDGVMPQTVEAINHAKAAGVEIIVAINKIDLPDANPDRVKQELTEHELLVEDWGGSTIAVPVSAKQKMGIEDLLEMVILASEMKELKANPNKNARGHIIEAKLDKGRGPVATVLVQSGTLKDGDPVVSGHCFGRIRTMLDDKGSRIKAAGPAIPVEIIGLSDVPSAGDMFYVAESDKHARQLAETVIARGRENLIKSTPNKVSLDDLFSQIQAGNIKDLNVVVKADVHGSVEALKASLEKLSNDEVRVRTIHGGVGAITESDVMLASASNAIIIGFNVRPDAQARSVAEAEKVDLRMYRVIYAAIEDIEAAMKGLLAPVFQEKILGHAEIRQLFKASSIGTIAGSHVIDGKIHRNNQVRVVRDGIVVYEGTLDTLRRFKDDVREVASGYECGMVFHRFNDLKENDIVEAFTMEEIPHA